MSTKLSRLLFFVIFFLFSCAFAKNLKQESVQLYPQIGQAVSLPLRDLALMQIIPNQEKPYEQFIGHLPPISLVAKVPIFSPSRFSAHQSNLAFSNERNFEGIPIGQGISLSPSDASGAAGRNNQYVLSVNIGIAVYDKTNGNTLAGPVGLSALWSTLPGLCSTSGRGDPIVVYDRIADRWIITQFAYKVINGKRQAPYSQCLAISQTSDATDRYNLYEYSFGDVWNDYGKLGVWPDGYYMGFYMFPTTGSPYVMGCVMDRENMLKGNVTRPMQCIIPEIKSSFMLPADFTGTIPPPENEPEYFIALDTNKSLNVWRWKTNWDQPDNTNLSSPQMLLVSPYNPIGLCRRPGYPTTPCVPQGDGISTRLAIISDRVMQPLTYRNFGGQNNTGMLTVNHSVWIKDNRNNFWAAVRLYQLKISNEVINDVKEITYIPNYSHRWMGSAVMDKLGHIAVGYTIADTNRKIFPTIGYALFDLNNNLKPIGKISQVGRGYQTNSRWGDYSSISIDPQDDCTYWYATQYLNQTGQFNWRTRIFTFKASDCN